MANGTDPRLELARLMLAGGAKNNTVSGGSLQERAAQQYAALTAKKKNTSPSTSSSVASPGGWKGVVSAAFDNPIAKTALAPLQMLDLGRSGIISGLKEISDAIDFNDDTKASFGDFTRQTRNHIGFGDIIAENGGLGNKWLDRIVGFAGDVAFDPMTYLTLGTGNLAGLTGRMNLAADIATQGAKNVAAGRITQEALNELVQRAGKKGLGRVTAAERAAYNLPEEGVRFMGRKIAGSEKLARGAGALFAGTRTGITDSGAWGKVFRTSEGMLRRAPDNLDAAYTKLATGKGRISATQAAGLVASTNAKAAKGGAFAGTWGRVAHDLWKDTRDRGARTAAVDMVERGDLADPTAAASAKWFEDVRQAHAAVTGKEIPKRPNYVPHMWDDFGRRLLNGDTDVARDLRKILRFTEREVKDLGHALERKIEAGTYKIAGKDVTFATGTIDDINRTLQREFPEIVGNKKVLLDDMPTIMGRYAKSVGEDVGNNAFLGKLKEIGIAVDDSVAMKTVVDTAATKEANATAAKGFKDSLDKGKAALDTAKANAKASISEATKTVGSTLKLRLTTLKTKDVALLKRWEELQMKLTADNVNYDAAMADVMATELDLQDQLKNVQDDFARQEAAVQADIAQVGADERALTKDRLAQRRQAIARRDAAAAKVQEISAHIEAVEEMKVQVQQARDELKRFESLDPATLPEEARKVATTRTVAKQQILDETGRVAATEEVPQVVRLSTKGDETYGLSKKLKIDKDAASSVIRQTVDSAGNHLDEETQAGIAAWTGRVQEIYDLGARGLSEEQLGKTVSGVDKISKELATAKMNLQFATQRGVKSTMNKWEAKVASLEEALKNAYDEVQTKGLRFDPNLPGSGFEQAQRQIAAEQDQVLAMAGERAKAMGLKGSDAVQYVDLVRKTMDAVDVMARYRNADGGGAFIVAAQNTLEESVTKFRIASDYRNRLAATLDVLQKNGVDITDDVYREHVQNYVMREVLNSEAANLRTARKELFDNLQHYADNRGNILDSGLQRTKALAEAEDQAAQIWDWIKPNIEELTAAVREAQSRAYEVAAPVGEETVNDFLDDAGRAIGGNAARMQVWKTYSQDIRKSIAQAIFWDDPKAAASFVNDKRLTTLLEGVSTKFTAKDKKEWIAAIANIRAGRALKATGKAETWYDLSAQAARRRIDLINERLSELGDLIDGLTHVKPLGRDTKTVADDIARFEKIRQDAIEELKALGRGGSDVTRQRAKMTRDYFGDLIESYKKSGRPMGARRFNAADVLEGRTRVSTTMANKELNAVQARIADLESAMRNIIDRGTLAEAVRDVPGRASIFTKGQNYIAAIDGELAILRQNLKTVTGQMRKDTLKYINILKKERATLEDAIKNATPLEDRLASAKKLLDEEKDAVRGLTGKGQAELDLKSKKAALETALTMVAYQGDVADSAVAAKKAQLEVAKGGLRETFDATVAATRDAVAATEAARSEIERILPAIEEIVRNIPNGAKSVKGSAELNDVFQWLMDAYDLLDPQGLVNRMADMPASMTPEMMQPNGLLGKVSNKEMAAFLAALPADSEARVALSLIYKAHEDAGKLLTLLGERESEQAMYKLAKEGELFSVMTRVLQDGFEELASSGIYVPTEVNAVLERLKTIDPGTGMKLLDTMNRYVDVWKAVKTTSPRFHIRNAMSATFMNYVAGVSTENMVRGMRWFREFEKDPVNWLDNIEPKYRKSAKEALDAVFASGGGQYAEIDNASTRISQRGVFRYSKMKGTTVEGTVRMGMALDALLPAELGGKAMSFDNAVGQITKYHFNYSQLSKMDRQAKAFIPFWTFMSRNLPLQIEQMWMNPKAYAVYNNFARNFRNEQEGDITPQWIKETGGWKLPFGDNLYATPDIGFNRVQQDIQQLRDPVRFGQNLNPVAKTALELFAGRQMYKNIPISSNKYVELAGPRRIAQPLLELGGAVERGVGGQPVVNEKINYALMQLVPGLQEAERLIAPSTKQYQEKLGMSRLAFLTGAPVSKATPSQILAERMRASREAKAALAKRKAISKATQG
jgi:hypothetical protein